MFDTWKQNGRPLSVLFCGKSGSFCTEAKVSGARNGRLILSGAGADASFKLKDAGFAYGPLMVFPRWPSPPPVEITALQAYFDGGDWLVLAEGVGPEMLSPMLLTM